MRYPEAVKEKSEGFDQAKMKSFGSAKHQEQIQKIKCTLENPALSTYLTIHREQLQPNLKNEQNGRKIDNVHSKATAEEIRMPN